ncbi:hypothetical protein [Modestobacter italicus]|uniref:hypothetical protein n=1 Tax=Modestobacter italicus (strain DSM 44449 / CECT 9708 / BC 501) TaxID=2732864 RepID=UPI001C95F885|nr:hypothetical protein [Modestobacter italicus]
MTPSGPDQSGHPEQAPWAAGQPAPGAWPPSGPGRPEHAQPWQAAQPPSWQQGQPTGHGDPAHGQSPYGQPPFGSSSYGPPTYGQPSYGAPPSYGPGPAYGPAPGHGLPARPSVGFDIRRLRIADHAVAAATLLTLVFMVPNWDSDGFFYAYNGFDVSPMTFGFLLLLLATAWTVVAAGADLRPQVPRGVVTVSLTGLALLMTLIAWLRTFADGFSVPAFLTLLAVTTAATFAVLGLLPELRARPALTGQLGQAAAWANQPGPGSAGAGATPRSAGWQPPQGAGWQPPQGAGWQPPQGTGWQPPHAAGWQAPQQPPWSPPGAQGWTAGQPPHGGASAWRQPDQDGAPGGPQPHDRG